MGGSRAVRVARTDEEVVLLVRESFAAAERAISAARAAVLVAVAAVALAVLGLVL